MEPPRTSVQSFGTSTYTNSWLAAVQGAASGQLLSSSVDSLDSDDADLDLATSVARMALASSESSTLEFDDRQEETNAHKKGVWRILPIDQSRFATASYDGVVKVWDVVHFERGPHVLSLKKDKGGKCEALSLALSDSNTLFTGNAQGYMSIWSTESFALKGFVKDEKKSNTGFYSMAFLGNHRVATGSCQRPANAKGNWPHVIKVWDLSSPALYQGLQPTATLTGHSGGISNIVALSPESFASSSGDKMIRVWDASTGSTSSILRGHADYVYGLCKIDDNTLLSGSRDTTAKVWDLRVNQVAFSLQMQAGATAHTSTVYDVAVCGENQVLTCSRDGYVKVWDNRSIGAILTLDTVGEFVFTAKKVGDATIVAGTGKGKIHKWSTNTNPQNKTAF